MQALEGRLSSAWFVGTFTIALSDRVSVCTIERMRTRHVAREGRRLVVPNGGARDTACGLLEFKDSGGMPFGWSKSLVREIVSACGHVLWRAC